METDVLTWKLWGALSLGSKKALTGRRGSAMSYTSVKNASGRSYSGLKPG